MHSVLQGDNNYFLLPSSVTLPAAPSLETLHGTHRSKTKHERGGSESVRLKEYDVYNTKKITDACNLYTKCGECWEGRNDHEEPVCVHAKHDVCVCLCVCFM